MDNRQSDAVGAWPVGWNRCAVGARAFAVGVSVARGVVEGADCF